MKNFTKFLVITSWLMLVSCSVGEQINLYNWTYFIPDEILHRFEKESGIKVRLESYDGNEAMYAKLATGNHHFDIAVPSGDFVSIMQKKGMLQELDHKLIPNLVNIDETVLSYTSLFDEKNRYSIPYFLGSPGINVNTDFVKDYERSWSIFTTNDPMLKGRMSMMNDMRDVMGGALRFLGFSGNSVNPDEIDQAKNLIINEWKPNVFFDAEGFGKGFASGSTLIAQGFAEVVLKEIEQPKMLEAHHFFIPDEGTMVYFDNFVVLKKGRNPTAAHQFINYMLQPDVHAYVADQFFYPTIITGADQLKETVAPYSIEEILEKGEFREDLGANLVLYSDAWNEIFQNN